MIRRHRLPFMLFAAALPAAASAQDEEGLATPPVFNELIACRSIADDAQRLACYDRQVAAIQTAEENEQIVVVDRAEIRDAERGLFGLRLPQIRLFGNEEDQLDEIETTITSASGGGTGRPWSFRLADGSLWFQIDSLMLYRDPRPGETVTIERAALGSFRMRVAGRLIRVRREE